MAKDKITITTPKGIAQYPKLNKADTKFDPEGAYKVTLALDADEAKPLLTKLNKIWEDHTGKKPKVSDNPMYKFEEDEDSGERTGRVLVKCKSKNKTLRNGDFWDRKPLIFDAKGNRLTEPPAIGGGSVLKLFLEIYAWQTPDGKKGVSLQPVKVQLIELVEYTGNDDSNPFDEEEGFTADTFNEDSFEGGAGNLDEDEDDF